jgi:NAD(P)-dependent dehydrogenase (short-subunit alcohol dehydrogenase family)
MSNQAYVVLGASGGIGSAVARRLVERGDTVHLVGRQKDKVAALGEQLQSKWSAVDILQDEDAFDTVLSECDETLDGLVYAIGSINLKSLKRLKQEDFLQDFHLNALGAVRAVQAALPKLQKAQQASIVLFSSVAASQGFPMHASMGMAKGAVSGFTLSLAAELAPSIRVNAIAPSLTKTPLTDKLLANPAMEEALAAQHPMQRLGTADDIASLACYLLSTESNWMTGQILGLDGGRSTLQNKK